VVVTGAGPQHLLKQDNPTVWELCHLRGGRVALREPASGRYLAAWNDGSMRLTFRLLEWETYELVIVGDPSSRRVAFRSVHDGRLLQAAPSERMWLGPACVAAELRPGHREVFHLVPVPPVAAGQAARYNTSEVTTLESSHRHALATLEHVLCDMCQPLLCVVLCMRGR
jgi:hypothetical protein